ncbi:H(+)/Cl(-) exchange transporter ClcA [Legionella oakridgensis]|uniref:Chloride channel protein EriC n=2 Tax=Legionella oakridgensis TaxID=29423 RepID=W0BBS4_9GAMM|nr:H(+)/Cl(-) exchange transporter ClcA [Legionella oakridgensis]AHE67280.1 chloride channel protein EriC [Legionella oakridgensis ATCC 33761 = DSM 21215]ETO93109.1 chloride channel protein EriC [Legionella oakridgensis RV-2-2007]KTD37932.1 voltage-gated chloride channel protein (ClC-type) [Legionella oakridgensis]STY20347.1 voltage-gated chloride channel protein (ClC-type) [Legionella longbeachae]
MRDKILIIYAVAILLGILTGIVGSVLQLGIQWCTNLLAWWFSFAKAHDWPVGIVSAVTTMTMVFIAWSLVKWIASEASGSGVQEIEGTLLHERPIFWRRLLPVKFIGGILSISAKMVVGREGPTIQIGGNLGEMLGEWFHMGRQRRDALIAAGAAAGLATAFNAPLAGVLFVLEEMRNEFNFSFTNFKTVAICCVSATIVLHMILGAHPAIPMSVFELPSLKSLWLFLIFGVIVGFVGLLFNILLIKTLDNLDKLGSLTRPMYVLLIGLGVGYLAYIYPDTVGGGYEIIEKALTMRPGFGMLCVLIVVRFIMTLLCYGTGVPGGIFAPMLALGTLLGLAASYLFQLIMSDMTVHPGMFAVAGMGALFAAAVRAPVTGIILVVEMTQNYLLILPLMVTCLTATVVVQLANNPPIYTQLLHRTLKKAGAYVHER